MNQKEFFQKIEDLGMTIANEGLDGVAIIHNTKMICRIPLGVLKRLIDFTSYYKLVQIKLKDSCVFCEENFIETCNNCGRKLCENHIDIREITSDRDEICYCVDCSKVIVEYEDKVEDYANERDLDLQTIKEDFKKNVIIEKDLDLEVIRKDILNIEDEEDEENEEM